MNGSEAAPADVQGGGESKVEFPLELERPELIERGKALIADARENLIQTNRERPGGEVCSRFSQFHDALISALYRHFIQRWETDGKGPVGSLSVVALGGYGRLELALLSDIDLLFLVGDRKGRQEEFIKDMLHVLYDWKLDLGHAVRRLEDCLAVVGTDLESTTSMMESRPIAGSRPLFQHYHEVLFRNLRGSGRRWFLQTKFREWHARHERYDTSVYLLEPNLKEVKGGLRDIHSVRWLLAILRPTNDLSELKALEICTPAEFKSLSEARDFILTLRNELHALSPRKSDVLSFEAQPEIARRLGFQAADHVLVEEALMRSYYERARYISKLCSRSFYVLLRREKSAVGNLIGSLRRKRVNKYLLSQGAVIFLDARQANYLEESPNRIMALFARARRLGMRVSERTREVIERIVPSLGETFQIDPENRKQFLDILRGTENVAQTLADMHDCGILSAYLPEFERVRCMVRIDHYHRYTVDEHLIRSVGESERLLQDYSEQGAHAAGVAREIERRDLLNLSLLLHDVGKGYGRGHALRGGQIIQRIGQRIGLEADEIETLRFLVLAHLKISHVAQRRDLYDPEVTRQLADEIGSLERLKLLYVHSVCDLMAVSPEAMTEWKARLYQTAYEVTKKVLGRSEETPEPHESRMETIGARVCDYIERHREEFGDDAKDRDQLRRDLEGFLESLPVRYLQATETRHIARQFLMVRGLNEENRILWSLEPGFGQSELIVCSADQPGSFAMVCGALATKDINIWSAQIFSTLDGYAINRFMVTDLHSQPLPKDFRLDRLRKDLNHVFLEKMSMEDLFKKYGAHSAKRQPTGSKRPFELRIDNKGSQQFTILEVRAQDRPGLLYRIASVLDDQKCNIHQAMVMTEAYGVMDVFYLTDLEYNKIDDDLKIKRLLSALQSEFVETPDTDPSPPAPSSPVAQPVGGEAYRED